MPQLEVTHYSSQIFWLILCISIIYFSFRYIFIPRIENSISARKRKIEDLLIEAQKMQLEANSLNKKYAEEVKKIHLNALEMHKKAVEEFNLSCDEELEKISEEQNKKIKLFKQELDEVKKEVEQNVSKEVDKLLKIFIDKIYSNSKTGK